MITYSPEKLNLWDRLFNRYKTIPIENGTELYRYYPFGMKPSFDYYFERDFTIYHKIDRLTGGYEIIKKYHKGYLP